MAPLRHLPTRRIVSMSMRAMKRAMAPPDRIERVTTSSGVNPTWGTMIVVAAQSAAVIYVLRIVDNLFSLKTAQDACFGGSCTAPDGCHCTCTGVPGCSMYDIFSFDVIFLHCKEEANEGGGGAGGRRGCGCLGWLGSHKELDVNQGERGGDCVSFTGAVFSGLEEEEERYPGEVCNCFSYRRVALGD